MELESLSDYIKVAIFCCVASSAIGWYISVARTASARASSQKEECLKVTELEALMVNSSGYNQINICPDYIPEEGTHK